MERHSVRLVWEHTELGVTGMYLDLNTLRGHVTLGESFSLSEPQFLYLRD